MNWLRYAIKKSSSEDYSELFSCMDTMANFAKNELSKEFPKEYQIVEGHVTIPKHDNPDWYDSFQHYWAKDGESVIDPTITQFERRGYNTSRVIYPDAPIDFKEHPGLDDYAVECIKDSRVKYYSLEDFLKKYNKQSTKIK